MSELPKGWVETTLGELVTFNPKLTLEDDTAVGFVPMSHAPTNFRDKLQFENRSWGEIRKTYTHFANGDVIFAKVTPCFENGKAAVASGLPNGSGAGSSEFHVLRPVNEDISPLYLLAVIKSAQFMHEGEAAMTGAVGLRRVPREFVSSFPVKLPPAAEQARIADKLDSLLAQVDTLKTRLDSLPALIKRFRQSVLAAAFSGKLTEDWRKMNPCPQWERKKIGELCKLKSGISIASNLEKKKGDFKYFKVGDMNTTGNEFHLSKTDRHLDRGDASENSLMPGSAIVFPKRGGAIATNKKRILKNASFVDLNIMGIITPESIDNLYVYRWFETIDLAKINSGSTIPQINNTDISPLEIPLPSLQEQKEIVRRVEQLFAFADQLETRLSDARKQVDNLTQSILAKAFRGELVPQDPSDEPASALLARISAQRAAAPKPKRGRKPA